jgi:hypothetical protein
MVRNNILAAGGSHRENRILLGPGLVALIHRTTVRSLCDLAWAYHVLVLGRCCTIAKVKDNYTDDLGESGQKGVPMHLILMLCVPWMVLCLF